jgi:8-oxo-dGTP diphosphatase
MKVRPAALIEVNNHVLLMRYRYSESDVFALPGGNPDRGEALTQTLERELREELGVEIEVGRMVLMGEVSVTERKEDVLHVVFLARVVAGIPSLNANETTANELVWKPLQTLSDLNLYPNIGSQLLTLNEPYVGIIKQPFFE